MSTKQSDQEYAAKLILLYIDMLAHRVIAINISDFSSYISMEKEGIIMWQGNCTFLSNQYHCLMVKLRTDEYLVAGYLNQNGNV